MDNRLEKAYKKENKCLLCGKSDATTLGVRGNREHRGADVKAEPHLFTNVVQCRNCNFIYTNPEIKGIEFLEREHYNNSEEYQTENTDDLLKMFEHRADYIKKIKNGGTLLDIGAGKGEFVFTAKKKGFEAVGIEPSPNFCEFAEKNYNVLVYQGVFGENEDLRGRKFDVITLHHVLEHVEKPDELLKRISEGLEKDGILYIEVPNAGSNAVRLIDLYFRLRGKNWSSRLSPLHPPFHKYGYTSTSLTYLLERCGYKVEKIETFSLLSRSFRVNDRTDVKGLIRNNAIKSLDVLGNRDMLTVIAKKKSHNG